MFYNVVLVSTVQQSEVEFPVLYSRFSLLIYFIHISVYMLIPISQFIPPNFSPLCLFSTSMSLLLSFKPVHLYHFSRFHKDVDGPRDCHTKSLLIHCSAIQKTSRVPMLTHVQTILGQIFSLLTSELTFPPSHCGSIWTWLHSKPASTPVLVWRRK